MPSAPVRGPYMNEDGDWWVAVEDVPSFAAARSHVGAHLSYDIPEDGTLRYLGKERTRLCDAAAGEHTDSLGGLDPAGCDDSCRRNVLAYHFAEHRRW